jgi:hypothetical protein
MRKSIRVNPLPARSLLIPVYIGTGIGFRRVKGNEVFMGILAFG